MGMENRGSFLSRIPIVTRIILIINIAAYLTCWWIDKVLPTYGFAENILGLHYIFSSSFYVWQPITYMFMHANFAHLFFNMFAVFMFAIPLERHWGAKRFLIYYLVSGIGAGIAQELVWWLTYGFVSMPGITIGASGAVFGILFAFGWLFPDTRLFIFPIPIPIRARIFVIIYALIELYQGVFKANGDNVAHYAHLGGLLFGWLIILYWKHSDKSFSATPSDSKLSNWWRNLKSKLRRRNNHTDDVYNGYHYQDPVNNSNTDNNTSNPTNTSSKNVADDAEKERRNSEINAILEKIRLSGYDSLTAEEKEKLFKK